MYCFPSSEWSDDAMTYKQTLPINFSFVVNNLF